MLQIMFESKNSNFQLQDRIHSRDKNFTQEYPKLVKINF